MKIVTPLSESDSFETLSQAGADEFYCGYVPISWLNKYGMAIPLNRRGFFDSSNIHSLSTMKILVKKMLYFKIPIKITFNEISYPYFLYPEILNIICELMHIGFSSFIISDIGLLIFLRENNINCDIHLSGEALVLNSNAMDFFDSLKISRYIFPRKTSLAVISGCINSRKNVECTYEAFMLNANCRYVGGFCNSLHCNELVSLCFVPSKIRMIDHGIRKSRDIRYLEIHQKRQNHIYNTMNIDKNEKKEYRLGTHGCGFCQIKALINAEVTHLKIVGRGDNEEIICKDILNLKKAISLAQQISNLHDFEQEVKRVFFPDGCPNEFCYYPH